jgi:hypothetical protein
MSEWEKFAQFIGRNVVLLEEGDEGMQEHKRNSYALPLLRQVFNGVETTRTSSAINEMNIL